MRDTVVETKRYIMPCHSLSLSTEMLTNHVVVEPKQNTIRMNEKDVQDLKKMA